MNASLVDIYQCDNQECQLRFPVCEMGTGPKRCPVCRSSLHVEHSFNNRYGSNGTRLNNKGWKIEVLLDNIRSAWNVGAIFRTSDGMGIKKIYCCGITPSPEHAQVSKTALGAELSINWVSSNNGFQMAKSLQSKGYSLWGLESVDGAIPLYSIEGIPIESPIILIVGNEKCGVDPAILELCDQIISIPMMGTKQSYNVAVAFGIAVSFLYYRHTVSHESLRMLPST